MALQIKYKLDYGIVHKKAYAYISECIYDVLKQQWIYTVSIYPNKKIRRAITKNTAISEVTVRPHNITYGASHHEIKLKMGKDTILRALYNHLKTKETFKNGREV